MLAFYLSEVITKLKQITVLLFLITTIIIINIFRVSSNKKSLTKNGVGFKPMSYDRKTSSPSHETLC